jgi:hypothetical protein
MCADHDQVGVALLGYVDDLRDRLTDQAGELVTNTALRE